MPRTKLESPVESAGGVAVPWDLLLDSLLKTVRLSDVSEEALALLRRLPPLPADLSADEVSGGFIDREKCRDVTRGCALAQIRKWRREPGGAFALWRWILNPHRRHDMNFTRRFFILVALGQDDGEQVLSLTNHLSLRAEPRNTRWPSGTMFLVLKNQ